MDVRLWLSLQDSIGLLLDAVRTSNEDLAQTWKKFEEWATIEQLCSKSQCFQLLFNHFSKIGYKWLKAKEESRVALKTIKLLSGASRHRWRTALQLPGLRGHGGLVSPLFILCHVVLPPLHIHEPAWNRALRNVQPTPQLKPSPPSHPTQPTASFHQDQPPDDFLFLLFFFVCLV